MSEAGARYEGFLDELRKLAASKHRLSVSKSRSGRRSISVQTLLKKDKEGTLFKKAEWQDKLPGGLADSKSPFDFSSASLRQGARVEGEHTKNRTLAKEIAMDHLTEDPKYYTKLRRMEKEAAEPEFKLQGSLKFQGLPIAIENAAGSVRKGVDSDGKKWRTVFKYPYGYIKNTEGNDGEEIDAYVGPNSKAPDAFVIHQRKLNGGSFDEDKVMLGFDSKSEARAAYLDHYNKVGPKLLGPISTIAIEELRRRLEERRKHTKLAMASYIDGDEKAERAVVGDVPSRDGTNPGAAGVEKREDGRGNAATIPTNGALASSGTGATTRL